MKRGGEYSFWRHRDRRPEIPSVSSDPDNTEQCDCCYCMYSPKPHQTRSLPPHISPEGRSRNRIHYNSTEKDRSIFSVTSYAGQSICGVNDSRRTRTNQDSLVMLEDPRTRSLVLACLDGHGTHGHIISQFFKYGLETRLLKHSLWEHDPKQAVTQLLLELEEEICAYPRVETKFSGTTLVLAIVRDNLLIVANVGDSRALLGSSPASSSTSLLHANATGEEPPQQLLLPILLTSDHKPELPQELSRILRAGGRVFPLTQEGPSACQRVWLGDEDLPGLAMSRSLGDEVARTIGVISTPEFVERQLDHYLDCLLVLGTDGLWDYLSNEEVMQMLAVQEAEAGAGAGAVCSPGQHVRCLIEEAKRRWLEAEECHDDITACVATLTGRKRQKLC